MSSLLSLDELRGARVLAGGGGLGRIVTGVNITEVPDVAKWLAGGEFLLSSGYPFRRDGESLARLLRELHDVGVSALGYKPGGWLTELPDSALSAANDFDLPIVLLPEELAYRDVFEAVYVHMYGRGKLREGPSLSTDLETLDHRHAIRDAVGAIGSRFDWTVELHDLIEHVVYTGTGDGDVVVDLVGGVTLAEPGLREDSPAAPDVPFSARLHAGEQLVGKLVVRPAGPPPARLDVAEVADYLERCMIRRQAYLDGQFAAVSLTYNLLVAGTLPARDANDRAQLLGLVDGRPYVVARLQAPPLTEPLRRWQVTIDMHLRDVVTVVGMDAAAPVLTLLVRADDIDAAVDRIHNVAGRLTAGADEPHRLGVSRGSDRVEDLPRLDRDSRIALDVAHRRGHTGPVRLDSPVLESVLLHVPEAVSAAYVDQRLGALSDEDMRRTLELYIGHHGNKSATAAALPMHRSGLHYRLKKLEQILQVDLSDSETMNELWLALALQRLSDVPDR